MSCRIFRLSRLMRCSFPNSESFIGYNCEKYDTGRQYYNIMHHRLSLVLVGFLYTACKFGFNYAAVNKIFADAGIFDPAEWGIAVMATFGYRSRDIMPKARKPFDEVVQWVY